jgi:hypothetical protein
MNKKIGKNQLYVEVQRALDETLFSALQNTADLLQRIDTLLLQMDYILNIAQPPLSGKIRIEWAKDKRGRVRPMPVVWTRLKGPEVRYRYKELPLANLPRRARKTGAFNENADWMRGLLIQVQWLLNIRGRAIESINKFKLTTENLGQANESSFGEIEWLVGDVFKTYGLDPTTWVSKGRKLSEQSEPAEEMQADE